MLIQISHTDKVPVVLASQIQNKDWTLPYSGTESQNDAPAVRNVSKRQLEKADNEHDKYKVHQKDQVQPFADLLVRLEGNTPNGAELLAEDPEGIRHFDYKNNNSRPLEARSSPPPTSVLLR